jgi:N-acetylglutamate synthase-like GNAT family acetyltransferase
VVDDTVVEHERAHDDPDVHVSVALEAGNVAGFVALKVHAADRMGEIYMIAVDPDLQRAASPLRAPSTRSPGSRKRA